MDSNDDRKKKRSLNDRESPIEEEKQSPRQRQRTYAGPPAAQQPSLTSFLADEHQRQASYEPEFLPQQQQEHRSTFYQQSARAPRADGLSYPEGHLSEGGSRRDSTMPERSLPGRHGRSESTDDSFAEAIAEIGTTTDDQAVAPAPRFDPGDLAWAEAERKLEYDVSSIQPLPILPPFQERRLLPLDRLLDQLHSSTMASNHRTGFGRDRLDPIGGYLGPRRSLNPDIVSRDIQHSRPTGSEFSPTRGTVDPRRRSEYSPNPISSFHLSQPQYDPTGSTTRSFAMPSSRFASMPGAPYQGDHHRHPSIQPVAAHHSIAPNSDGGYVIPVLAPNDRMAMTPYQFMLRESLEYFTAVEDDVKTTVQGRRKPVLPGQLGIRCRYCSHLPVAGRMRAAVYYPRSLLNLYQGAQNIASVHFQQCTEFPAEILQRLMKEKPRRDFSKVGKPYWAETCRQLGIYEEDEALWFRVPPSESSSTTTSTLDQRKPPGKFGN